MRLVDCNCMAEILVSMPPHITLWTRVEFNRMHNKVNETKTNRCDIYSYVELYIPRGIDSRYLLRQRADTWSSYLRIHHVSIADWDNAFIYMDEKIESEKKEERIFCTLIRCLSYCDLQVKIHIDWCDDKAKNETKRNKKKTCLLVASRCIPIFGQHILSFASRAHFVPFFFDLLR